MPSPPDPVPLTGERTAPGIAHENYWFRRHEAVYQWVAALVTGRTVLEVGSGEGYGTALLARSARAVVGLDYDGRTTAHAAASYPGTWFARGNLAALPARTARFDLVVTLQVIEHVWDHGQFLAGCARVLRPGGTLVVSTPNRLTFSPGRDRPLNPFHTREFAPDELVELVEGHGLAVQRLLGLHAGPRLGELDARFGGLVDAQLAAPPEAWPAALRTAVAGVRATDFVLRGEGVDPAGSLDLVLLARRP